MMKAKGAMISGQVEFAKAGIDHKCQKIKKKIKDLENRLLSIENRLYDRNNKYNEINLEGLNEERLEVINSIKKREDKIDSLRLIKMSLDTINFNAL